MTKNGLKFNFFAEVKIIIIAILFFVFSSVYNFWEYGIISLNEIIRFLMSSSLLFLYFGFFGIDKEKGWLFSAAFIVEIIFDIKDMLLFAKGYFGLSISYFVAIVSSFLFVLYGFGKIKNKKYCYIAAILILINFIYLRLTFSFEYLFSMIDLHISFLNMIKIMWREIIQPILSYSLMILAVLFFLIPTKKKRKLENEISIETALRRLKEEYDNKLISEEEYLSKKKEFINNI